MKSGINCGNTVIACGAAKRLRIASMCLLVYLACSLHFNDFCIFLGAPASVGHVAMRAADKISMALPHVSGRTTPGVEIIVTASPWAVEM